MKFITVLFSLLLGCIMLSNQAFAHTDHVLGDGSVHALYHAVFWGVFALVVYKAHAWYKNKKSQKDS